MDELGTLFQLDIPVRRLRPIRGSTLEGMTPFLRDKVMDVMQNSKRVIHIEVSSVKTFKEFAISVGQMPHSNTQHNKPRTSSSMGYGLACHECESLMMCRLGKTFPSICPCCYATGLITDGIGLQAIMNPAFQEGEYALGDRETPRVLLHGNSLSISMRMSSRPHLATNPKAPCVVDYHSYNYGEILTVDENNIQFVQVKCPTCKAHEIEDELVGSMTPSTDCNVITHGDFWIALAALEYPNEFSDYTKGLEHTLVGSSKTLRSIPSLGREKLRGVVPTRQRDDYVNTRRLASGIKRVARETALEFLLDVVGGDRTTCNISIE